MPTDEEMLYRLIGEKIRQARQRVSKGKGISQMKLAKMLGLSRASIVNIEAGRQRPPLHVIWEIAEKLDTEAAHLIPQKDEYRKSGDPVTLDRDTIAQIEAAANGDSSTKRSLTEFISRAKSKTAKS